VNTSRDRPRHWKPPSFVRPERPSPTQRDPLRNPRPPRLRVPPSREHLVRQRLSPPPQSRSPHLRPPPQQRPPRPSQPLPLPRHARRQRPTRPVPPLRVQQRPQRRHLPHPAQPRLRPPQRVAPQRQHPPICPGRVRVRVATTRSRRLVQARLARVAITPSRRLALVHPVRRVQARPRVAPVRVQELQVPVQAPPPQAERVRHQVVVQAASLRVPPVVPQEAAQASVVAQVELLQAAVPPRVAAVVAEAPQVHSAVKAEGLRADGSPSGPSGPNTNSSRRHPLAACRSLVATATRRCACVAVRR